MNTLVSGSTRFFFFQRAMSVMLRSFLLFIAFLLRSRKLLKASGLAVFEACFVTTAGLLTPILFSSSLRFLSLLSYYSRKDGRFLIYSALYKTASRACAANFFSLSILACSLLCYASAFALIAANCLSLRAFIASARAFLAAACCKISSSRFSSN